MKELTKSQIKEKKRNETKAKLRSKLSGKRILEVKSNCQIIIQSLWNAYSSNRIFCFPKGQSILRNWKEKLRKIGNVNIWYFF